MTPPDLNETLQHYEARWKNKTLGKMTPLAKMRSRNKMIPHGK